MNHDQMYCTINCLPNNLRVNGFGVLLHNNIKLHLFRFTLIYKIPVNMS